MGFEHRVRESVAAAVSGWGLAGQGDRLVTMTEGAMENLETEMEGYTQVGGSRHDLQPWDQTKMQKIAIHLFRHNHMAKRLIEIIVDFVLGDGLTVGAINDDDDLKELIQGILDGFWDDPINDMGQYNPQRLTKLNIMGELVIPVQVNGLGDVRLGMIDPTHITKVTPDPLTMRPGQVHLSQEAARSAGKPVLEVIRYNDKEGRLVGDCFYQMINSADVNLRGVSEYFTASDWFDVYDETMKSASDRAKLGLNYIWDVTLTGENEKGIKKWTKAQKPPKPNSLRVHNEKVKWQALAPNLGAYEISRHGKDLKTLIMGGFGLPNHWFGSGDDANLATAAVMAEPTRKALKRKTRQFTYLLTDILRFVLTQKVGRDVPGGLPADFDPLANNFEITVPDIGGPDVAKIGSAMQQITSAVVLAQDNDLVGDDTARTIFASVAGLTGVAVDPAEEEKRIEAENETKAKEDGEKRDADVQRVQQALRDQQGEPEPVGAEES